MKQKLVVGALAVMFTTGLWAKDIKKAVFTTEPEMHCHTCVNRIKSNMRFEKGVKLVEPDLETKLVTITYDADKTTIEKLVDGFQKIKYKATPVEKKEKDKKKK